MILCFGGCFVFGVVVVDVEGLLGDRCAERGDLALVVLLLVGVDVDDDVAGSGGGVRVPSFSSDVTIGTVSSITVSYSTSTQRRARTADSCEAD